MSYALVNILRDSGEYESDELSRIDDLLFSAASAQDLGRVESVAREIFSIVAPSADSSELMSSAKNLHSMRLTRSDAVRGVHATRAWMARIASNVRRRTRPCDTTTAIEYDLNGLTRVRNFAGDDAAGHLSSLIKKMPVATSKNGANLVLGHSDEVSQALLAKVREVVFDCHALPMDHAEGNSQIAVNTFFQRVRNAPGDGDVQKIHHQDTYFSALKFWYFPDAVGLDDGPFHYVCRSHLLTRERLNFIHRQSLAFYDGTIEEGRTYGHAEGSLRAFENELKDMDLVEEVVTCEPDTLVVANVFGFHRRGEARREHTRDAIHGSIRLDRPFQ